MQSYESSQYQVICTDYLKCTRHGVDDKVLGHPHSCLDSPASERTLSNQPSVDRGPRECDALTPD